MSFPLTIQDFIQRVKMHNERQSQWNAEKEALSRELSILMGQKAAIDLVKYELQEKIYSLQRSLGLPLEIDLPPRPTAPPIQIAPPEPVVFFSSEPPTPAEPRANSAASSGETGNRRIARKSTKRRAGKTPVIPATEAVAYDYKPKHEISVHLDCVRALCFYESSPIIVSGSDDGTIRVTNLEAKVTVSRKTVRRVVNFASLRAHGGPVLCLVGFERNGEQMMISSGIDGVICIWALPPVGTGIFDIHGILTHHRVSEIRVHQEAVWSVDVLEDLLTGISAGADGNVMSWQIGNGAAVKVDVGEFGVTVKALTERRFAVGCKSGNVRVFNGLEQVSVIAAGKAPILKIALGADEGQILAMCDDNVVRVVDVQEKSVTNELDGHENGLTSLCLTPDKEFLITTGNDAAVNVWRTGEFVRVDNVKLHSTKYGEGALCCAAAPPKCGKVCFATGGAEGTIQVFVKG